MQLTEEQKHRLADLYRAGANWTEMSKALGIGIWHARAQIRYMRGAGADLPIREKVVKVRTSFKWTPELSGTAEALYRAGDSVARIGEVVGTTPAKVSSHLQALRRKDQSLQKRVKVSKAAIIKDLLMRARAHCPQGLCEEIDRAVAPPARLFVDSDGTTIVGG